MVLEEKSKHRYSTYLIILIILILGVCLVIGISSEEIDEICDQPNSLLLRNGEWHCQDANNLTGNTTITGELNVTGIINNIKPHMFGIATKQQTALATNTWYNITFNKSIGDIELMTFNGNNDTLIINYSGHYTITFGVSTIDTSPSPNAQIGLRLTNNNEQILGSYYEITTTKQNALQFKEHTTHTYLEQGDKINMQWITSDLDVTINSFGTYTDTLKTVAYGFIIRN